MEERMDEPAPARLGHASKTFGSVVALRDVSLHVNPGETLAVLGPNGAGKTTAIRLLLGLIAPTSATARVFGGDPRHASMRARIGAMLQVASVPATLTVREHIELFSSYYPRPLPLAQSIETAALGGLERRQFGTLSGGQKQRLFLALASAVARGKSIILTTHYIAEAEALADRVVMLAGGAIVAEGTPAQMKDRAGSPDLESAFLALTRTEIEAVSRAPHARPGEALSAGSRVVRTRLGPAPQPVLDALVAPATRRRVLCSAGVPVGAVFETVTFMIAPLGAAAEASAIVPVKPAAEGSVCAPETAIGIELLALCAGAAVCVFPAGGAPIDEDAPPPPPPHPPRVKASASIAMAARVVEVAINFVMRLLSGVFHQQTIGVFARVRENTSP